MVVSERERPGMSLRDCPACNGTGQMRADDKMRDLIAVWVELSKYDQNEVLLYAQYLRQRRARSRERAKCKNSDGVIITNVTG